MTRRLDRSSWLVTQRRAAPASSGGFQTSMSVEIPTSADICSLNPRGSTPTTV